MRISDCSSDVCSSDLCSAAPGRCVMPEPVRSALVTGSCGGLGFAVAESLAAIGCNIMLHGLEDDDNAEPVRAALAGRSGVKVAYHRADLTDLSAVDRLMQTGRRSEEHTSELPSLMRISYAVFCFKKKKKKK